jgi:hypothetical protein
VSRLQGIEEIVLGPLAARDETDWQRAPAGKWTPAQIVEHLALAFEYSARGVDARREQAPMTPAMPTPRQWVGRLFVFGWGWVPTGVARSPRVARPAARVMASIAEARFRDGLARWRALERDLLPVRPHDLFVRHPSLGDLDVDQWIRLHAWHCRHHAKQIRRRLAG